LESSLNFWRLSPFAYALCAPSFSNPVTINEVRRKLKLELPQMERKSAGPFQFYCRNMGHINLIKETLTKLRTYDEKLNEKEEYPIVITRGCSVAILEFNLKTFMNLCRVFNMFSELDEPEDWVHQAFLRATMALIGLAIWFFSLGISLEDLLEKFKKIELPTKAISDFLQVFDNTPSCFESLEWLQIIKKAIGPSFPEKGQLAIEEFIYFTPG